MNFIPENEKVWTLTRTEAALLSVVGSLLACHGMMIKINVHAYIEQVRNMKLCF